MIVGYHFPYQCSRRVRYMLAWTNPQEWCEILKDEKNFRRRWKASKRVCQLMKPHSRSKSCVTLQNQSTLQSFSQDNAQSPREASSLTLLSPFDFPASVHARSESRWKLTENGHKLCLQKIWTFDSPDYWRFHPTLHPNTGRFTRALGFSTFCPISQLCTRLLGFAPDHWALHPPAGPCIQPLGFTNYWASHLTSTLFM